MVGGIKLGVGVGDLSCLLVMQSGSPVLCAEVSVDAGIKLGGGVGDFGYQLSTVLNSPYKPALAFAVARSL